MTESEAFGTKPGDKLLAISKDEISFIYRCLAIAQSEIHGQRQRYITKNPYFQNHDEIMELFDKQEDEIHNFINRLGNL